MKAMPATYQYGVLSLESLPAGLREEGYIRGNVGLQTAADGRIWLCIKGVAFLRFSPPPDGKMRP